MRARLSYFVMAALLVVYFVLVGSRGVLLIEQGTAVTIVFGVAVLVLPLVGVWFLWHTTRFARQAGGLARELEAEGGLPIDELRRTPSGRIDRASADEVFAKRQAEAERAPDDWRAWFRLAVAYHDARDTPRARKTMQHAIALHDRDARDARDPAARNAPGAREADSGDDGKDADSAGPEGR